MNKISLLLLTILCYGVSALAQITPASVCVGATTTLTCSSCSGGTWSSGNTGVATVGSTGDVTGITNGTVRISYINGGTSINAVITVNTTPVLTGIGSLCVSASTKFTDSKGLIGGTWSSSDASVAAVSSGTVTGIAAGTAIITYTHSGCNGTAAITVPTVITSPSITAQNNSYPVKVCEGSTIQLTVNPLTGGTWSSTNTSVVTVGSTGVMKGTDQAAPVNATAYIQYIKDGGCATTEATVTALPAISLPTNLCLSSTTVVTIDPLAAGTWTSSESSITLTTNPSNNFEVSAYADHEGTAQILFTRASEYNCTNNLSKSASVYVIEPTHTIGLWDSINVNSANTIFGGPDNTINVCVNEPEILHVISHSGTWSGSGITGIVTGGNLDFYRFTAPSSVGTATVTFVSSNNTCTTSVHLNFVDLSEPIIGSTAICVGSNSTLSHPVSGGSWLSSNTAVATVGSTGIVTGISPGTAIISYKMTRWTCFATTVVTVLTTPSAIGGPSTVCTGNTISLTNTVAGGTWSSSSSAATVGSASGIVSGLSAGTSTITYSVSGCTPAVKQITVNTSPAAISGASAICMGQTITFTNSTSGGTWSSSNAAVAAVGTSGLITSVSPGTAIISYTLSNGCYAIKSITVGAPITGLSISETAPLISTDATLAYCGGFTLQVSGVPSGITPIWSPTISPTPSVMATNVSYTFTSAPAAGVYTVTVSNAGCSATATVNIVVATGGCYPCGQFTPPSGSECSGADTFKIITGDLTAGVIRTDSAKNYFISTGNHYISVSPAPGSIFYMDKNAKLYVATSVNVLLDSCHFFSSASCAWKGIAVLSSGNTTGKLKVTGNTLIEHTSNSLSPYGDAAVGVAYSASITPTGNVIESDKAIFNQNVGGGIGVANSAGTTTFLPPAVVVKNTVFTARALNTYHRTSSSCSYRDYYPFSWPTAADLKQQTVSGSPTDYSPVFGVDAYSVAATTAMFIGMKFFAVGTSNTVTPTFSGITVGDGTTADNYNLFDLNTNVNSSGLNIVSSNITSTNNVFRNCAYGITGSSNYSQAVQILPGSGSGTHNRFYNCSNGVNVGNVYYFLGRGSEMSATNSKSNTSALKGLYGYKVSTSSNFLMHIIDENTIKNYQFGIATLATAKTNRNGSVYVRNNVISGLSSVSGSEYSEIGILFNFEGTTDAVTRSNMYINNNDIQGCFIGIDGYAKNQPAYIDSNRIKLTKLSLPYSFIGGILISWGSIPASRPRTNMLQSISYNHIYGDTTNVGYKAPVTSVYRQAMVGYTGIQIEKTGVADSVCNVFCNYIHDIPIGFNFLDVSYLSWKNNIMTRNKIGMALQMEHDVTYPYPASIGIQGSSCTPSDNHWYDDGAGIGGWPGWVGISGSDTSWQTYTNGEDPNGNTSNLYVRAGAEYTPASAACRTATFSVGSSTYTGVAYTAGTSLIAATTSCLPTVATCNPYFGGTLARHGNDGNEERSSFAIPGEMFSIYPNPNNGTVNISTGNLSSQEVYIRVCNFAGSSLYNAPHILQSGNTSLSLSGATPGIYIVTITERNGMAHNYKLIIQQ